MFLFYRSLFVLFNFINLLLTTHSNTQERCFALHACRLNLCSFIHSFIHSIIYFSIVSFFFSSLRFIPFYSIHSGKTDTVWAERFPDLMEIMRQIGREDVLKFRIGLDGLQHRLCGVQSETDQRPTPEGMCCREFLRRRFPSRYAGNWFFRYRR